MTLSLDSEWVCSELGSIDFETGGCSCLAYCSAFSLDRSFRSGDIDTAQVVRHVGELFAGEQALIFEFNMFVPEEYRTAAPPGYYRQ